ncbi:hypothetical protein BV912_06425 [Neisseria dumasiana]|uniref:Uncharacterized protein n=1 Tax=Neisseria dumasiana TaxID=1931275 RepID=A0A1X3DIK9_9NEIS|nr:hypothetical protein BV912_06425 [Neisseria dumasiana]
MDDFIKEHNLKPEKNKKSVLAPYQDEIFKMKEMGFTEKIILQFLKEKKGISVSQQTLNWFIRSRKNDTKPFSVIQKQTTDQPKKRDSSITFINQEQNNHDANGRPRRFEMGEMPSDEVIFGTSSKS